MFEDRDDVYDRLLDGLDRGRLNRLTFIRKALALGIAAPAISATLAQLPLTQGVEADGQKVAPATINYWSVVTQKTAFDQGEGSVIKLFEKAYPHLKVVVQEIPFADYTTKLSTAARAGTPPDVARVNHPDLQSYAGAGWLTPLDSYVASSKVIKPKDYFPGFYAITFFTGKQYALPVGTDNRCLYYNKHIFKEAGLVDKAGNPAPPKTWNDLVKASAQIKKRVKGVYPIAMAMGQPYGISYQSFGNFMITNGGYLLSQHGRPRAIAATDPATVQAWNWFFGELYLKGQAFAPGEVQIDGSAEQALFAHGVAAMIHDGPWAKPELINPQMRFGPDYGMAGTPVRLPSQHAAATQGGWLLGLFQASKNKAAGWAFIEFTQRAEINAIWNSPEAFPPMDAGWKYKPFADNPFYRVYHAQLPYSRPPITPLVPQTPEIAHEMDVAGTKVMLGQMAPGQALRSFDDQANGTLR
jgi:multiple sugar transport system substrate-binding protein